MIDNDQKLLLTVSNIAIKAGNIIMKHYNADSTVLKKEDQSPLTEADLASNKIISAKLKLYDDNIPILSEEALVSWNQRKDWETYWLVDPLDGTKEFINKNGEFTVNIALIKKMNLYLELFILQHYLFYILQKKIKVLIKLIVQMYYY